MTEARKQQYRPYLGLMDATSIATILDASLNQRSSTSVKLSEATVAVSLDKLGDWTITIGLSARSDRFQEMTASLERIGFFQATETEGTSYLFWTSALEIEDSRTMTEETLLHALKALQAPGLRRYIS